MYGKKTGASRRTTLSSQASDAAAVSADADPAMSLVPRTGRADATGIEWFVSRIAHCILHFRNEAE